MTYRSLIVAAALALVLAGCTTVRETNPDRTATEQLLISKAADEAAKRLDLPIPEGTRVFLDASNFEGTDGKYAIGAIRDELLKNGARLADDKGKADVVVSVRSGALSADKTVTLLGIPKSDVPVPLSGPLTIPEIALFKKSERKGVAKFVATAYRAEDGRFIGTTNPQFGFSHKREWVFLLFFSWKTDDLIPEAQQDTS